jgi:hypothetical protein
MTRRRTVKLLPEGTALLAMLSDPRRVGSLDVVISEDPPKTIRPKFGGWFDRRRGPQTPLLVPLRLGPLLPLQASPDDDAKGGLWMALEGARTISLISSSVLLPKAVSKDAVRSLNHAYTRLSEHFETQRISHTGNVYEQVLYQEPNGLWYPLKVFRDEKIADEEWRTVRDSNPRDGSPPTHFPGVRLRPLGQLSVARGLAGGQGLCKGGCHRPAARARAGTRSPYPVRRRE